MSATYSFVALPLDATESSARSFALRLLSTIEFSAGTTLGADIAAAVRNHPLLGRDTAQPVPALAMPYAAWAKVHQIAIDTPGVTKVQLRYGGKTAFADLRTVLADYLERPTAVPVAPLRPDSKADERVSSHFLDIAGAHDRLTELRSLVGQDFAARAKLRPTMFDDLTDSSIGYKRRRWIDGHSQATILALLFGSLKAQDLGIGSKGGELVARLRTDIAAQRRRLAAATVPDVGGEGLRATSASGDVEVDPRDPNAAVHAGLNNSIIAQATGMVTAWNATSDVPLTGDLVIALDPSTFPASASISCKVTAFRRAGSTHPLSFDDIGRPTQNGVLAALNDDAGAARYSATGINAEMAFIQGTILQAGNSVANAPSDAPAKLSPGIARRDDRAPVELAAQQVGYNELEAAGLTFSAPVVDLVSPGALKSPSRQIDLPCLFLEDLWIGYRLDLAAEGGGRLRSVHFQNQRIVFSTASRILNGVAEDFWPREAPNADPDQLSTEIIRYNGLSAAQMLDYAKFLGTYKPPATPENAPFTVDVEGASGATPLHFGETYRYRLRNVFQGGISLADDDAGLDALGARYIQQVQYLRARSYRAGEVIIPRVGDTGSEPAMSIFLKEGAKTARVLVAPAPVDADTARYNGQFLASTNEATLDAERAFVSDLPGYLRSAGEDAPYYCDPVVSAISVELWVRNGDPQSTMRQFHVQDGIYCELIDPLHVGPVVARFGRVGRWREFRPIEIIFTTTTDLRPRLKLEARGRRVRIAVPVAADIELVLTPVLAPGAVQRSARFAPSSSMVAVTRQALLEAGAGLPVVEHRIRVVHCTRTPVFAPRIFSEASAVAGTSLALMKRTPASDRADLTGYIEADAASSGELQVSAAWREIDDDPMHDRYVLKEGQAISRPHSLQFRELSSPGPGLSLKRFLENAPGFAAIADTASNIGRQCVENRVFLGGVQPGDPVGDPIGEVSPPGSIALGNTRRARVAVTATAKARYAALFAADPKRPTQIASRPVAAEVPAAMLLPVPLISHVMPLVSQRDVRDRRRLTRETIYAFRIYVRRPWFLSGHGERLAIGCHTGAPPSGPRTVLDKTYSQWGEDPIARTRTESSKRLPRAADFQAASGATFDPALYFADAPEGRDAVLYYDDIVREPDPANATAPDEVGRVALASYALRWHEAQKLWYCDIHLAGGFSGWIGLALYRHQPLALEGRQISQTAAWLYSQQLQGERVSWFRQNDILHVTIGPVFDGTYHFEAEQRRYHDGVSLVSGEQPLERLQFERFEVDGKSYFEGRFAVAGCIEIIRRRFDFDITSFTLEAL